MKKIYFLISFLIGLNYSYGQLIINEVLYDPSNSALEGDANGDGIYSQDDDSFIEIYNSGSSSFDISGYEIWDDTTSGGTNQYTIPANTQIPAGEVIVIFGGGTPTGSFGGSTVLNAGTGFNFNNSGEVIGVKDANGNWALTFDSDALSNNPNESYTRDPDVTGTFTQHASTSSSALFSPGTRIDGTHFSWTVGIEEQQQKLELSLYPNPVENILSLSTQEQVESIEIYNVEGQVVKTSHNFNGKIDVSELPSGVYILRAIAQSGVTSLQFIRD